MRFIYDLKNQTVVNGKSDPEIERIASGVISDVDFTDFCIICGSDVCDKGRVFYSILVKRTASGDIMASVTAVYGDKRECVYEVLGDCLLDGDTELSTASLRATLKRVYSGVSAYISLPSDKIESCAPAIMQLYKYADEYIINNFRICVNATPAYLYDSKVIALVAEDSSGHLDDSYPYDLASSADKGTDLDALVDHLIKCESGERIEFLDLVNKYAKYCDGSAEKIYKAFVEGDEEMLFELVHAYCVDSYSRSCTAVIEDGVKSVIRQNLRDRLVLKLIYDGFDTTPFIKLIEKNRSEIAFCAAFREVDALFEGDNAESYNIILASHVTSGVDEGANVYQLVKEEMARVDLIMNNAENAIEFSMIESYRKVLGSLMTRAEEVTDIADSVLAKVTDYFALCSGAALYSEETDKAISDICEKAGSDYITLREEIEQIRYRRYCETIVGIVESACNTDNNPEETIKEADKFLEISKSVSSYDDDSDPSEDNERSELSAKLKMISRMNSDNYLEVYRELFGSEYINELLDVEEGENEDNEKYLDYFLSKLCSVFSSYSDFIGEINAYESVSENAALKLLIKEKFSDMLYSALANCDTESFAEVVARYDVDRVDDRVFFPMLFKKARDLAIHSNGYEFIDKAIDCTDNEIVRALLLGAKLASNIELPPQSFYIDLEELVSKFSLVEKYINGDIVFSASVSGVKYSALSLRLYIDARHGENMENVLRVAQNSPVFNNFLAAMQVEGFEHIEENVKVVEVVKEVVREVIKEVPTPDAPQSDEIDLSSLADDTPADNAVTDEDIVIINKKSKKKKMDDTFETPEKYNVIVRKDNPEKMKTQMIALGIVTAVVLGILIYLFLK